MLAQTGNAFVAAVTANAAVSASPREMSASLLAQSNGQRVSNVLGDETRLPLIKWSGETLTPSIIKRLRMVLSLR